MTTASPDAFTLRIIHAHESARAHLLSHRTPAGHWEGELSSSALSTATAIIALSTVDRPAHSSLIQRGLAWLTTTLSSSGGWGDTPISAPNLSTTLLVHAAYGAAEAALPPTAAAYLQTLLGGSEPQHIQRALLAKYGKDKTFSVPILMACTIGGLLGPTGWDHVPQLPFELASLPRSFFAAVRLPVVSYALPALIAIGQARFHHRPCRGPLAWWRQRVRASTLTLLHQIQPAGGGYLEATPLTSFVTMALASMGLHTHPVVVAGTDFLIQSIRSDGSWPIDTNLSTWVTTLAIKALGSHEDPTLAAWLLRQHHRTTHPFTGSAPGGWAWTDLPGGVPDADDTSGAILALRLLGTGVAESAAGAHWLAGLQNTDGGIPTFCRGWGTLPFDRSTPDITAHALAAWQDHPHHARRALHYLRQSQRPDGAWLPLWFGNEAAPHMGNPVYGTATVLGHLAPLPAAATLCEKAAAYLLTAQQPSGAWGGDTLVPPSIEETSVALTALMRHAQQHPSPALHDAIHRATHALLTLTAEGTHFPPAPIGLYFASLWYYERLYPIVHAVTALRTAAAHLAT